jgi:hypothetical protein
MTDPETTTTTTTATATTVPPLQAARTAEPLVARLEANGPVALIDQLLAETTAARALLAMTTRATQTRAEASEALGLVADQLEHVRDLVLADQDDADALPEQREAGQ